MKRLLPLLLLGAGVALAGPRGTGDLAVVIERGNGSVQVLETSGNTSLARVEGLGDLSHASRSSRATAATPTCSDATAD